MLRSFFVKNLFFENYYDKFIFGVLEFFYRRRAYDRIKNNGL